MTPTDRQIDAGAKALHERLSADKIKQPWHVLSNNSKRKWRDHAACVLRAALLDERTEKGGER